MSLLTLRKTYDFGVYGSTVLGNNYKHVTVLAYLDYESAIQFGQDIRALHQQLYAYLPTGTPNDPTQYNYYKLKTLNGSTIVLGELWISPGTVTEVASGPAMVKIPDVTAADFVKIRNALSSNGFKVSEINFI